MNNTNLVKELSERDLLLLSNYLYIDNATELGTVGDTINRMRYPDGSFDPLKLPAPKGGMTQEDVIYILNEITESKGNICDLNVTHSVSELDIRAACFVDTNQGATVIYRGTGGSYEAWHDNFVGEFMRETGLQMRANSFIRSECGEYKNITVAGHSKGGNFAQLATLLNGSLIDRCVSFDGQGFNRDFIRANEGEIRKNRSKIVSISAHNDFVNILLIPVAGARYYVKNTQDGYMAHSGIPLLTDNEFDENGNFAASTYCKQSTTSAILEGFLANGVIMLDQLPKGTNEKVVTLLSSIISGMLTSNQSFEYETLSVCGDALQLQRFLTQKVSDGFSFQYDDIMNAEDQLFRAKNKIKENLTELRESTQLMCEDFYTIKFSRLLIEAIMARLETEEAVITKAWDVLCRIRQTYQAHEKDIINRIQS